MTSAESCECDMCQSYCRYKSGWFRPGEAERVAKFLAISLPELFREKLMADYWVRDDDFDHDIYTLSPAVRGGQPGTVFPFDPSGECIFFQAGKCVIHEVKPWECKVAWHGNESHGEHREVAQAWNTFENQAQISKLLRDVHQDKEER